jgi:hypothetical protein
MSQVNEQLNKLEQADQGTGGGRTGVAKHYGVPRRRRQRENVKMGSVINA